MKTVSLDQSVQFDIPIELYQETQDQIAEHHRNDTLKEIEELDKRIKNIAQEIDGISNKMTSTNSEVSTYDSKFADPSINMAELLDHDPYFDLNSVTESHHIKLSNGHLHFDDEIYNFNDPKKPQSNTIKNEEFTIQEILVAVGLFLLCVFLLFFVFWLIKKTIGKL